MVAQTVVLDFGRRYWFGILHKAVNNFTGFDLHTEENV